MFACLHGSGALTRISGTGLAEVRAGGENTGEHRLTALALEFSPVVEESGPGTVAFDVSGLDRLFGHPQDLAAAIARRAAEVQVKANLALADNPDAAICAARGFAGVHVIPRGDEGKYLGELPVELLAPSAELRETLERWGIRRFRDLAALPPLGIAERLGAEGLRLRERARGEAERKLVPVEEPARFEDSIELEYPVDLLDPLEFMLARLLNGLATRLATRGLATDELRLLLKLETRATHARTLRLPVPSLDSKAMLKLMRLDLEAHPPAAPVVHVWLGTRPVKPRAAQGGLYAPMAPEPVGLRLTLARIRMVVGDGRVGTPELLDTHRPDAFRMEEAGAAKPHAEGRPPAVARLALRRFRPPRRARVDIASGKPGYVAAEGIRGTVLDLAGPWRTSGDWWTADSWSRDEWDIALSDGALYRIYCEPKGWFVEGNYD